MPCRSEAFRRAVSSVNALTDRYPESAKAGELFSKTYLGLKFLEPALRAAEEWVRLEPNSVAARQQRDEVLKALNAWNHRDKHQRSF